MLPLPDNNLLFIDKPKGISSFDVIRRLRKIIGNRKMGHAGTLDPLATGLLIIGVDDGTKELEQYLGSDKTYEAEVLLGISTETDDMEGNVTASKSTESVSKEKIEKALSKMNGEITIPVPLYSAIKVNGTPLYKYARAGKAISPPRRVMEVVSAELKSVSHEEETIKEVTQAFSRASINFDVGSGTYIRSLAVELGRRLDCPATLSNLRRTSIADISIEQAYTLEELAGLSS